jgi:hypothetical protein
VGNVKWGRVADPEPRIISLLRTIAERNHSGFPQDEVVRAFSDLDNIVKAWLDRESLTELRELLGVTQSKKRRTQRTVNRETAITMAVVNAALRGNDDPKKTAGDEIPAEEREVQRAWKEWGELRLSELEAISDHPTLGPPARVALAKLKGDKK